MENLFLQFLNLTLTASYLALAIILLRLVLQKAPKWVNCALWALLALRLLLPFSLESALSLIPSAEPIPSDIMMSPHPQIETGINAVNSVVNPVIESIYTPDPVASANPLQISFLIWSRVWLIGIAGMLIWSAVSYLKLRKQTAPSLLLRDNIYLCDGIDTPFILGIFRPRIYLPSTLSEGEQSHVLAHEQMHIRRGDHIWKPLGFLLLSVYWFNPLFWLCYNLFCRDVEKACDERVIRNMAVEERKDYSSALLSCSVRKVSLTACPLAFGEIGVKARIKSILSYKKPAFWIIALSILLCVALAVGFLTVPKEANKGETEPQNLSAEQQALMEQFPQYFGLDASNGLDVYVWQMAENSYSFGLLEHSDTRRDPLSTELINLKGVGVTSMHLILATYDIAEKDIHVIPWSNPVSSYIPAYAMGANEELIEVNRILYAEQIKNMLLNNAPFLSAVYDHAILDVDGDGANEVCMLRYGRTSGIFTFQFLALNEVTYEVKYDSTFTSKWFSLSFKECDDGIIRVQGVTQDDPPQTHLFDIGVSGGHITLTQNGIPVGEVSTEERHITYEYAQYVDFGSKDLSSVDKIVINASGVETEIIDPKQIAVLVKAIKTIEGENPISNKGYYGWHYAVSLYCGEEKFFSFSLFSDIDRIALTYGLYETVGNHDYPCRYTLTNCSYENIESVLKAIISEN